MSTRHAGVPRVRSVGAAEHVRQWLDPWLASETTEFADVLEALPASFADTTRPNASASR